MKRVLLTIIMLVIFAFWGCSTESENPPAADTPSTEPILEIHASDFFPMAPGSLWVYKGDGNEYASYTREILFKEGSSFQASTDNGGTVSSTVYLVGDNEVKILFFKGEEYDMTNLIGESPNTDEVILMGPLEPGTEWESNGTKREIISLNETVNTPAGIFEDCLAVKSDYPNSYILDYYVSEIGLVFSEFHSGESIVTSTLESYFIAD